MSNQGPEIIDFRESWLHEVAAYQDKVKSHQMFLQLSENSMERSFRSPKLKNVSRASNNTPKQYEKVDEAKLEKTSRYIVNTYHVQLLKKALLKNPALLGQDLENTFESVLRAQNQRDATFRPSDFKKNTPLATSLPNTIKNTHKTDLSQSQNEPIRTTGPRPAGITVPEAHVILDNIHRTLNGLNKNTTLIKQSSKIQDAVHVQPKKEPSRPSLEKQSSVDDKTSEDSALGDELPDEDDSSEISTDTEDEYTGQNDGLNDASIEVRPLSSLPDHVALAQSEEAEPEKSFTPKSVLMPSLFPQVPPYITFYSHVDKAPSIHSELQQVLKWKTTSVTPKIVRYVVENTGIRLLKKTNDWMGTWDKHMKSSDFKEIKSFQKYNHLPGSFRIGRKDSLWRSLKHKIDKYGKKEFGFMRRTFIMPEDLPQLKRAWHKYHKLKTKWIIKPPASARGFGVSLISEWSEVPQNTATLIQKYIERPLLINGNKFDLRLYVLITSVDPLRIFLHNEGLVRFASVQYSDKMDTIHDRCMHLTNYSINKLSENYMKNDSINACSGHKWTLKSLWTYFRSKNISVESVWSKIRNLIVRTVMAGENGIGSLTRRSVTSKNNCYELLGFDVLLDENLTPWLLEVNISPSLHIELALDRYVKGPLVQSVLNIASYQVPPKLSKQQQKDILTQLNLSSPLCYDKRLYVTALSNEEATKQKQFARKSIVCREEYLDAILENLTPDDIRSLIIAEDELARCSPMERIFPAPNSHTYFQYFETPRYYNRLLDAWETQYAANRDDGIEYLRKLCETGYHLKVATSGTPGESNDEDENI